ncbi:glycosyltransferase family 2 protein [Clostridium perfringens]
MQDLVSIIMPSYNTAKYISETIESVQSQTYPFWELIIVDDCSTDNTDEVVKPYLLDDRIRYLKNDSNSGAAISRNRALREARGRWVAFLDSDDLWKAEKLEKQIRFMKDNNYHFSYTNYEEIDENSQPLGIRVTGPKKISKQGMYNYCYPGCLTVMYDAKYVGMIQINDIKKNNDYAMWIEVCQKVDCWLLDEYLGKYRKRSGSISRHGIKTMIGWHYKLWHEAENKNVLMSFWYTGWNLFFGFIKKKKYVKREVQ